MRLRSACGLLLQLALMLLVCSAPGAEATWGADVRWEVLRLHYNGHGPTEIIRHLALIDMQLLGKQTAWNWIHEFEQTGVCRRVGAAAAPCAARPDPGQPLGPHLPGAA